MILYASTIFLGAFLLFLVQPIMAKQILPWFGGSAAVWATCMVFFQVMLLAGYAYADWTTRRMAPKTQVRLHVGLLVLSLLLMPIIPDSAWKPTGEENPSVRILAMLGVSIGLPYLLLATTSPLVQAWFVRRYRGALPYRLFALSNLASLLALLAYPVMVEPWISTRAQSIGWSSAYALFVALCGAAGLAALKSTAAPTAQPAATAAPIPDGAPPTRSLQLLWLLLAALGSFMLLAVTNHICQNVASIPFLWIVPLGLYLATFILAFDHPRWYHRGFFIALTAIAVPAMAYMFDSLALAYAVPIYLVGLFAVCMFCHGEFSQLKPSPRYLTTYYLMLSLGGAIGGLLVGLVAPYVLPGHFEIVIGLIACGLLLLARTWSWGWWASGIAAAVVGTTAWASGHAIEDQVSNARVMMRNFYSAIRTRDATEPTRFRSLVHGGIMHGGQLLDEDKQLAASSYFGPTSGFGRLFAALPDEPRRVGIIGLGAGSIMAHARAGDVFRFYEINPQVVDLAYREFTFLTASKATTEVVLGDGRLSMEREPAQRYDVIAVDAFSGDAIPMHLLTRESLAIYLRHLKPDGVIAFQATNRFVDIAPVVERLAAEHGMTAVMITDYPPSSEGVDYWLSSTDQILVTRNRALLEHEKIRSAAQRLEPRPGFRTWTDDFNNLLTVLK
ncbi:MAG: fused MFS/spermidine synthase [Burkholderiales bacterium]|nr:fused MFS/spermidine synthase [Burkholderiales bacterium]